MGRKRGGTSSPAIGSRSKLGEITKDPPGVEEGVIVGDKSQKVVVGKRKGPTEKNIPEKRSKKRKGEGVEPYQVTFMNELLAFGIGGIEQFEDSDGSNESAQASEDEGGSDEQGSDEDEELQHLERKISKGKVEASKLKKKMAKAREAKLINAARARVLDPQQAVIV